MSYDKVVDSTQLDGYFTGIANAIRGKNGSSNTYTPAQMPQAITDIPSGGGAVESDVNFYDYDGTLVDSYTAAEFASLSAMPANPTHQGLTSQGWNWTLADAKDYVSKYGGLDIGQLYITTSGATEIDIELEEYRLKPYIYFQFTSSTSACSVTLDWGDGSQIETFSAIKNELGLVNVQHEYAAPGKYTVKIMQDTGNPEIIISSTNTNFCRLLRITDVVSSVSGDNVYYAAIKHIRLGNGVKRLYKYAFQYTGLRTITIPTSLTYIDKYAFQYCYYLQSICLSSGCIIEKSAFNYCRRMSVVCLSKTFSFVYDSNFQNCYSLRKIYMSETTTLLPQSIFNSCTNLFKVVLPKITQFSTSALQNTNIEEIKLPNTVTEIGSSVFNGCYGLRSIDTGEALTKIGSTAFGNCPALAFVKVPATLTSIGSTAFGPSTGIGCFLCYATTPPTLSGALPSFWTYGGYIYVPRASISTYESTTNWSAAAGYYRAIEDYTDDGTLSGNFTGVLYQA